MEDTSPFSFWGGGAKEGKNKGLQFMTDFKSIAQLKKTFKVSIELGLYQLSCVIKDNSYSFQLQLIHLN